MMRPNMTRPQIELHIEELVLDGFAPVDRERIGAAVVSELTRLFDEQDGASVLRDRTSDAGRVDAGAFELTPDTSAHEVGAQIARRVYHGLCQTNEGKTKPLCTESAEI